MVEAVQVGPADTVLEIGPGTGSLTAVLTVRAKQVVAVEVDPTLAQELSDRVPADNLTVINDDILKTDLTSLPSGYKVVANIPYYLTSNLLRVLSETTNPPAAVALLVQREVAERVAARPGDMSLLSVSAQFYWRVSLGQVVPATLFIPAPKVDSQILVLWRRATPLFQDIDAKQYFRVARAGFSQRRKTLSNALSAGLHLTKAETDRQLSAAGIRPETRAQALSLEDWYRLTRVLEGKEA